MHLDKASPMQLPSIPLQPLRPPTDLTHWHLPKPIPPQLPILTAEVLPVRQPTCPSRADTTATDASTANTSASFKRIEGSHFGQHEFGRVKV
ncbi:MAG: hypothetical protein R3C56_30235 [Pirellulaceae bacterium]